MSDVYLSDLPDEIIKYIFMLVSPYKDLETCKSVCKDWYHLVKETVKELHIQHVQGLCEWPLKWETQISGRPPKFINERFAHSACILDGAMYVFGGWTNTVAAFNDLWKFDLSTRSWSRPLAMGTYPRPKGCATLVPYKNTLVLFGGCQPLAGNLGFSHFQEIHMYDTITNKWNQVYETRPTGNDLPPGTAEHTATVHGDLMVVFGGTVIPQPGLIPHSTNDLWCFNLQTWVWFQPQINPGSIPHSRYRHSQVKLDDKHMIITGGCGGPNMVMNDMWLLTIPEDPVKGVWHWSKLTVNDGPQCTTEFRWHKACMIAGYVVLVYSKGNLSSLKVGWKLPHSGNACPADVVMAPCVPASKNNLKREQSPELCVNGRRGILRRRKARMSPSSSSEESDAAPSCSKPPPVVRNTVKPSIRPNSMKNRERQLEGLNRMEEKIRALRRHQQYRYEDDRRYCTECKRYSKPVGSPMSVSVLDVSKVMTEGCVNWLPDRTPCCAGPEETILYSLLPGRGEVIVFGGMHKKKSSNHVEKATNAVHFLKLPVLVP